MQKKDIWTKLYEKYFDIFKEECDLIEDEGIEILKAYYYENILPNIFNYSVESHNNSYDDSELMTELEAYVLERIKELLQSKKWSANLSIN